MRNMHNLDLLRSLAVTMVVYDHTAVSFGHYVPGGGIFGVYLFFVHTSLVLMWSLERQPFVLPFYIRRIFRIYPLAITAIAAALVFRLPVAFGGGWYTFHPFTLSTIVSNVLLLQDLIRRPNIVGVFWSLSIEVQMYVVLPALFFFAIRERKIWQMLLLWLLAIACIRSSVPKSYGNVLLTVAPHFLAGVIAFIAFGKLKPVLPSWLFLPYLLLLVALFLHHPGLRRVYPITLLLGLSLPLFRQITARPFVFLFQHIALYSYGIYVWHELGIKLADHFLSGHADALKITAALLFTAVVSILGYHLIEAPMMQLGFRAQKLVRPTARKTIPELEPVP